MLSEKQMAKCQFQKFLDWLRNPKSDNLSDMGFDQKIFP